MSNYTFISILLPQLEINSVPEISFKQFCDLLKQNLSPKDYIETVKLRLFEDILNLKAFWLGEPIDKRGNLNKAELEEALFFENVKLPYVKKYLDKYESKEERLKHFSELVADFFGYEATHSKGFIKKYYELQRELRLVFTAIRAKQLGRDLNKELQYEPADDEFVQELLAQKDAKDFVIPEKYQDLRPLLDREGQNPLTLHKAMIEYLFSKIDEIAGVESFSQDPLQLDPFTFDSILAYMAKLMMVEKWHELDQEKGNEIVESIVKESA